MLVEEAQRLPYRQERVLGELDVVIVDALRRVPSRILQLRHHQEGSLHGNVASTPQALPTEKFKSPPVSSVGPLAQTLCRGRRFGQPGVQSLVVGTRSLASAIGQCWPRRVSSGNGITFTLSRMLMATASSSTSLHHLGSPSPGWAPLPITITKVQRRKSSLIFFSFSTL